ncbi:putative L-lactate dehydrogenase operon regulatory protein [compost metagenome]
MGTGVFAASKEGTVMAAASGSATNAAQGQDDIGPFDLLEARLMIEPECAGMAAQQATPAQLAAIREAHEGMSLTDSPGRHDREFHSAIAAACGNAALAATVTHLWNLTQSSSVYRRMQDYFVDTKVWAAAHAEHQRILTALLARDPIRARHAMHAHLLGILARLREDFNEHRGDP